ncbi:MAG TPA: Dyp-type peroxidase [Mycobacteriales bacterium]|nr:Dyp-type peroxidase [Mycobacteriales bacterium]
MTAQPGIFAQGVAEHAFLELDLRPGATVPDLLTALASLTSGAAGLTSVSAVVGVRPSLVAGIVSAPEGAADFADDIVGPDGFRMPATQHDAFVWLAAANRTAVYDNGVDALAVLTACTTVATSLDGWPYKHNRDLTGFVDGTENPPPLEAVSVAAAADGASVVLFQKWTHDHVAWGALSEGEQEKVIGRTKVDDVELDDDVQSPDAHVPRNVIEDEDGEELAIYRRNVAYGNVTDHGTVFVGFCADQRVLARMLRRMAGAEDGIRDALTRYTSPVSGAYYLCPSVEDLAKHAPPEAD